jgi:hypothetical protein
VLFPHIQDIVLQDEFIDKVWDFEVEAQVRYYSYLRDEQLAKRLGNLFLSLFDLLLFPEAFLKAVVTKNLFPLMYELLQNKLDVCFSIQMDDMNVRRIMVDSNYGLGSVVCVCVARKPALGITVSGISFSTISKSSLFIITWFHFHFCVCRCKLLSTNC